jgi:hypothetical protein
MTELRPGSNGRNHLRLPLGRDEWIAFNGSTVLGDAFVEPAQGQKALIKRYSNRSASPFNDQGIGCTKAINKFLVGNRDRNGVSFGRNLRIPAYSARLHMNGIAFSTLQFPVWGLIEQRSLNPMKRAVAKESAMKAAPTMSGPHRPPLTKSPTQR